MGKKVMLATHMAPVIHGQAMIAAQLMNVSKGWSEHKLFGLNTAYVERRRKLRSFSLGKVWRLYKYMRQAKKMIKENEITHVILCAAFFKGPFLKDVVFGNYLKKYCGVELIGWIHMDPNRIGLNDQPQWFQKLAHNFLDNFSYFVAGAPALVEQWPKWLTQKAPTKFIANGVTDPVKETPSRDFSDTIDVIYLSAIDDEKGWRELLEVAKDVCAADDRFRFNFHGNVGAQLNREEVTQQFEALEHKDRIQWHGMIVEPEKIPMMLRSTVFVLPSYTEQFSIAILEAMACGLPIIATDVGATKDAIEAEWLVRPKDAKELKDALLKMCDNPERMRQISLRNRAKFVNEFTDEKFSNNWENLLSEI